MGRRGSVVSPSLKASTMGAHPVPQGPCPQDHLGGGVDAAISQAFMLLLYALPPGMALSELKGFWWPLGASGRVRRPRPLGL